MNAAPAVSVRRDIAAAILAEVSANASTVIAELIAHAFAARLTDAQSDRGFLHLAAWADRTCEHYGALSSVTPVLRIACPVAQDVLRRRGIATGSLESDLGALHTSLSAKLDLLLANAISESHTVSDGIDEAIAAFLMRLDDNDPLSAEHSRAVALWCRRLARKLQLPDERRIFVARGGLLHDVGKTTTPKDILLAPRALTNDEFLTMRDHAVAGANMIKESERLRPFMHIVGGHHERLDGKGYPDRLTASEISLEVRIVSVADCFNAMIGRRPYRAPLSPAVALDQLLKHRGTQFDPLVVEAMIDIVEHPDE